MYGAVILMLVGHHINTGECLNWCVESREAWCFLSGVNIDFFNEKVNKYVYELFSMF